MLRQLSLAALLSLYLFVSSNRRDKPNTALLALRVQRSSPATPSVRKPLSHKDVAQAVFCHGSKVRGRSSGGRRKDRPTDGRFWDTRGCHRERFYPGRFGAAVRAMEVAVWPPRPGDSAVVGSNSNGHGGYSTRIMSDLGASATAACSQLEGACQSR